ncbi:MAG TPA: 50S ribosomal protein L2, partial [Desulfobacterales bacterium]|nr:50S ribosomal protein L2 [Desulfobacterales bacterium]
GKCRVLDIVHDPLHTAPLARLRLESGGDAWAIANEGLHVGAVIESGVDASIKIGNTLPIGNIPEGTTIFNVEKNPGDGGKFARSGGNNALVVSHGSDKTVIRLPSGNLISLDNKCRATMGVIAGGGRSDKPFVKAGKRWHAQKSRATNYPKVSGVAKNPVDHPHGGGAHQHVGKPATVSRHAPPGKKVGSIAARRTGGK